MESLNYRPASQNATYLPPIFLDHVFIEQMMTFGFSVGTNRFGLELIFLGLQERFCLVLILALLLAAQ